MISDEQLNKLNAEINQMNLAKVERVKFVKTASLKMQEAQVFAQLAEEEVKGGDRLVAPIQQMEMMTIGLPKNRVRKQVLSHVDFINVR